VSTLLVLVGVAAPQAIGALTPGYEWREDFLSELGALGAPHAALMNYGVFLPVGVLWAVATILLWRSLPIGAAGATGAVLLFGNTVSYVGAAFYACDPGCPSEGTVSQFMHNLTGAVGYFLTPPALALLGAHLVTKGRALAGFVTLGVAALFSASFIVMLGKLDATDAGLWQRLTDYSLFVWMLFAAVATPSRQALAPIVVR
jgi:hypothetical membrane protein